MAQICRTYKFDVPILMRVCSNHGNSQRRQCNHYDALRITKDATQKEIRAAYIKLSKEMHPDCGKKGSHADFVKINEAYAVLSKDNKRQMYDMNLRYSNVGCNRDSFRGYNYYEYAGPHSFYRNSRQTRNNNANSRSKQSPKQVLREGVILCLILISIGTTIGLIRIHKPIAPDRYKQSERTTELKRQYEKLKNGGADLTLEEKFELLHKLTVEHGFTRSEK